MKKLLLSAVLGIGMFIAIAGRSAAAGAPDFSLAGIDNSQFTLSKNKGKVVFVDFWASWCPPCRKSIPAVEELYQTFKNEKVEVVGINVEGDASKARAFAKKNGMQYSVLVDDGRAARNYGVSGIPAFFIIDAKGNIAKRYVGYQPGVEDEWAAEIRKLLASTPKAVVPASTKGKTQKKAK